MHMMYKNYIDGGWVEGKNGTKYASLNPANEEIVGEISQAEVSDVEAAVEAASRAFNAWRLTPAPRRGEILYRVGQLLQERKEQLSQLLTREMGKVIAEARGDVRKRLTWRFTWAGKGDAC